MKYIPLNIPDMEAFAAILKQKPLFVITFAPIYREMRWVIKPTTRFCTQKHEYCFKYWRVVSSATILELMKDTFFTKEQLDRCLSMPHFKDLDLDKDIRVPPLTNSPYIYGVTGVTFDTTLDQMRIKVAAVNRRARYAFKIGTTNNADDYIVR